MEFESLRDLRLHGFAKIFHHIFMFFTYPIRHPFKFVVFLLVLAILLFVASFFVPQTSEWSLSTAEDILHKVSSNADGNIKEIISSKTEKTLKKFSKQLKLKHAEPQFADNSEHLQVVQNEKKSYQVWHIPTKALTHSVPEEKQDEKLQESIEEKQEPDVIKTEPQSVSAEPQKFPYQMAENAHLVYDENKPTISGNAIIYGPNELYVSGTYLYLYGIKTDSLKYDIEKATSYLRELINSEEIECYGVDKTEDDILTAICFKSGVNINKKMVEAGFADDINL